jgi:hypothetical protein
MLTARPALKSKGFTKNMPYADPEDHAAYMREWRKTHLLSEKARRKDITRSYAGVYKRRGKLVPKPCQMCGHKKVEMHHPDYGRPLYVFWLCRPCHLALHAACDLTEPMNENTTGAGR